MGTGSLKRIAALTALAMTSVMFSGAVNVGALPGVPSTPSVSTTLPTTGQVTVPSTTVTVPQTPVTPTTTVTTPTVTTPTAPAPVPKVPTVQAPKTPTVSAPKPSAPKLPTGGGGGGGIVGGSPTSTVQNITGTATDVTSGGTTTKVTSGTTKVTSGAGTVSAGGSAGSSGGGTAAQQGLAALGAVGGPPAAGGGTGGPGSGIFGGTGGGSGKGGALPAKLSPEKAAQLRFALDQLEGCLGAIAPIDRQVLGMRAGAGGGTPLSRSQVASQLGVSTRQVRLSERRGITGLRNAAEQTGCAGALGGPFAVSGIGALPLTTLAFAPTGGGLAPAGSGGGEFVPARQAEPGTGSPRFGLDGAGGSGPAWLVVLITVLFSVAIAGLMRELRSSVAPRI